MTEILVDAILHHLPAGRQRFHLARFRARRQIEIEQRAFQCAVVEPIFLFRVQTDGAAKRIVRRDHAGMPAGKFCLELFAQQSIQTQRCSRPTFIRSPYGGLEITRPGIVEFVRTMQMLERLPAELDESRKLRLPARCAWLRSRRTDPRSNPKNTDRICCRPDNARACASSCSIFHNAASCAFPALESEAFAPQPRRHVGNHHGGLDEQRARTAQRIDDAAAGCVDRRPARAQQHRAREIFFQRREPRAFAIAALMQRRAGQIDADDRFALAKREIDAQIGDLRIDIGPLAILVAQLIDDGILDAERRILRMRDAGVLPTASMANVASTGR